MSYITANPVLVILMVVLILVTLFNGIAHMIRLSRYKYLTAIIVEQQNTISHLRKGHKNPELYFQLFIQETIIVSTALTIKVSEALTYSEFVKADKSGYNFVRVLIPHIPKHDLYRIAFECPIHNLLP